MQVIYILFAVVVLFGPAVLAIVALVKVSDLKREMDRLRLRLVDRECVRAGESAILPPNPMVPVVTEPEIEPVSIEVPPLPVAPVLPARQRAGFEFMLGGNAAAFAGIAILITGIVFLVGYGIQQALIGPSARVVIGLLCGGVLVGGGHYIGRKDKKFLLFARVLTGGGAALFYFTVFSAYAFYHLIGAVAAGAGLFASALAVFGLAMGYRSQSVAILGVLGAFITPLFIGGHMDAGVFPMVYVSLVNVPVLLLGVRRKWQALYNLAFAFTILHYAWWFDWRGDQELWAGLGFAVLFFVQYAALGLLTLRSQQKVSERTGDLVRLVLSSILLLGALFWLLDDAGKNQWIGALFLMMAFVHIALSRVAFKIVTRFNGGMIAFLAGGILFATLALPAQLDGEWVSLGWAIEGAVLAWFAVRVQSRVLLAGALCLGLVGLLKGVVYDTSFYQIPPRLFLNARFLVGFLSAGLFGVQGFFAGRVRCDQAIGRWQEPLWWVAILGATVVFFTETFRVLGAENAYSWLITSIMLLVTGILLVLQTGIQSSLARLGSVLLLLVPCKLLIVDAWIGQDIGGYGLVPFGNAIIWMELSVVAIILLVIPSRFLRSHCVFVLRPVSLARVLNGLSLAAAIGLISFEIGRMNSEWAGSFITIFWALSAMALILCGMKRRVVSHRYFGLILFGLTTIKVLVNDSSELEGLERIAAFIGTGLLLLALSFAYQKAASYFREQS